MKKPVFYYTKYKFKIKFKTKIKQNFETFFFILVYLHFLKVAVLSPIWHTISIVSITKKKVTIKKKRKKKEEFLIKI